MEINNNDGVTFLYKGIKNMTAVLQLVYEK